MVTARAKPRGAVFDTDNYRNGEMCLAELGELSYNPREMHSETRKEIYKKFVELEETTLGKLLSKDSFNLLANYLLSDGHRLTDIVRYRSEPKSNYKLIRIGDIGYSERRKEIHKFRFDK